MKIVLDSNVIIAAFATKGLCSKVFEFCIDNHEIIVSEFIIKEVEKNLSVKLEMPLEKIKEIIELIRSVSKIVSPDSIDKHICNDEGDLPIIGTAIAGRAKCVITGDPDLFKIKEYKNIKFLTPRDFWDFSKLEQDK